MSGEEMIIAVRDKSSLFPLTYLHLLRYHKITVEYMSIERNLFFPSDDMASTTI